MTLASLTARKVAWSMALLTTFGLTLSARVWRIDRHFWLLGDQVRDWATALRSFDELPLVGPPTHFEGYAIGPAFYWILWIIRVTVGPWFDLLPHAGGIGQAILQSAIDAVLLYSIWFRTQSLCVAVSAVILLVSAPYDLALAALVWNPVVGATLAKFATALVLLGSARRWFAVLVTAAIAWCAVHANTGAIFVTLSVFAALLIEPAARKEWASARRNCLLITAVVLSLQLPYLAFRMRGDFDQDAMRVVAGSIVKILAGDAPIQLGRSHNAYADALAFIQGSPWDVPWLVWLVIAGGIVVAVRYRGEPTMLAVLLLPQIGALAGYAFFLEHLDRYYYLSLMPAAVLTVLLSVTMLPWPRVARVIGIASVIGAVCIVPARIRFAATLHKLPEYGPLLDGSRTLAKLHRPLRTIETEFPLHVTTDRTFLFQILGGEIDPSSSLVGVISAEGRIIIKPHP